MNPDPIIGQRHPYYLAPWKNAENEVFTGVFAHYNPEPRQPLDMFRDGDAAFRYVHALNMAARNGVKHG